jgi:hypothetical protein
MLYEWRKIWRSLRVQAEFLRLSEGAQLSWFRLILVADDDGLCPPCRDLAWEWRLSDTECATRLSELEGLGWIREAGDRLQIVRWSEFQGPDSDSLRARRKRARDTKRDENVTQVTRDRHASDTLRREEKRREENNPQIPNGTVGSNAADVASAPAESPKPKRTRAPKPELKYSGDEAMRLRTWWDTYRALWSPNASDERFWGPTKQAVALRSAAAGMLKAKAPLFTGLLGLYMDPYWRERGCPPDSAARVANIERGEERWKRLDAATKQAVIDHVKKWEVWNESRQSNTTNNGTNTGSTTGSGTTSTTRPAPDNADGGLDSREVRSGAGGDAAAAV